jgi:hypothetical protein
LKEEIPMVSLHLLVRILHSQQISGAWINLCEVTAYNILALSSLVRLPWIQQLDMNCIIKAMERGKSFLLSKRNQWSKGHYMWIEKVTYASDILSEAYCLAAALVPTPLDVASQKLHSSYGLPDKILRGMRKTGQLIAHTPLFLSTESYIMRAAEIQAGFAFCALQRKSIKIFPRTAKGDDKYMFIIPLALTASSAAQGCVFSLTILREMMVLSVLNFLADEYMEGVIEKRFSDNLDPVKSLIQQLFAGIASTHGGNEIGGDALQFDSESKTSNGQLVEEQSSLKDVRMVLYRFIEQILHHPAVLSSPRRLQTRLAIELKTFLLAHVTHAEDNHRFGHQLALSHSHGGTYMQEGQPQLPEYLEPGRTFYNWVRSISADHTSCPFSFIFFNCLVQASSSQLVHTDIVGASARIAYLAEDLCRHLASMCRMYNDYGSLRRDADERNLNSVNFPEFHSSIMTSLLSSEVREEEQRAKSELLWIVEYERRGLETALMLLEQELGSREKRTVDSLKMFVNLTNLYGEIYILRDVGTRTK